LAPRCITVLGVEGECVGSTALALLRFGVEAPYSKRLDEPLLFVRGASGRVDGTHGQALQGDQGSGK
jgi:hypothetical protein